MSRERNEALLSRSRSRLRRTGWSYLASISSFIYIFT
jgi:hypothetical protein